MNEESKREARRLLEEIQRDLQALTANRGSRRGHSDYPNEVELEYHLTRLTSALHGFQMGSFRFSLYSHRERAELLAQLDALLTQTSEITELAERAREVLLRPPPEDKEPGFTE
jgi:hypothetical protein